MNGRRTERWDAASRGLSLERPARKELGRDGIYVEADVSLEYQPLAKRHVVRGVESGGAVGKVGRYVTFTGPDGEPLEYLHPMDAVGRNGVHAVVVAPVL